MTMWLWSHYVLGDARCDVVPKLDLYLDEWVCPKCGSMVMSNLKAHAERLLPWSKWVAIAERERSRPPPLEGFVWVWSDGAWIGVRIASPDPEAYKVPYIGDPPPRGVSLWRLAALLGGVFALGMCV